ncbi:MAG: amidoligase family protein [Akkermansiaceae bacterium]|nr:amidoligase family protein [Akkermansiaceae bacterium]MCF7731301.1 amidoligase family protein [Akkermansiaceae bacterium]
MRSQDTKAEQITFGVELETTIPATSGINVGGYHCGAPVRGGTDMATNQPLTAPTFNGNHWKAERDGSIRITTGRMACEFVSPVLHGAAGVENLIQFVEWANAIGANVNASCGCHITVGVASIIGTNDPQAMSEFARKLAHIARWHAMSLYGQTGTGRHLNHYSHVLDDSVGGLVRRMERATQPNRKADAANRCGRGMLNLRKLFTHGVIELPTRARVALRAAYGWLSRSARFRVFAGTLNAHKIMHHLATVLGLCRRAAEVECLGAFSKNKA